MDRKAYTTTDRAGFFVAGKRVPTWHNPDSNAVEPKPGSTLMLTEAEAKYEITAGTIEPAAAHKPAEPAGGGQSTGGSDPGEGRDSPSRGRRKE